MSPAVRNLGIFAVALVALFGLAVVAGRLLDPHAPDGEAAADHSNRHPKEMEDMTSEHVRGLAVAENGLRLVIEDPEVRRGAAGELRFRIVDREGRAVRDFDVEHTKRMHVIVVRRDLTEFQHLHAAMGPDGTWSTPLRLPDGGSYRVFADFSHEGRPTTLAGDLRVDGAADLQALPAPQPVATSDGGYHVRLAAGAARPGRETMLRFTVTRGGRPVDVEPYLGAGGHLVALREGDLAFLHIHPVEQANGDSIAFAATFPTEGKYRLFLQFRVAGRVQTAAFTQEALGGR
ncbi:MAG: hypothetical protein ACJ76K_14175 [Solirubrobacteraceae bacterium]